MSQIMKATVEPVLKNHAIGHVSEDRWPLVIGSFTLNVGLKKNLVQTDIHQDR